MNPAGKPGAISDCWRVIEDHFEPARQRAAETILSVGNGRFSTRGSLEEGHPDDEPATFMHGIFVPHPVAVRQLANLPNWTTLEVVVDGETFSLQAGSLLAHRRCLDLQTGLLTREVSWQTGAGTTVGLVFERFASLAEPDLAAVRVGVSVDRPALVEVRASLDDSATNDGERFLERRSEEVDQDHATLDLALRGSDHTLALAMRLDVPGLPAARTGARLPHGPSLLARWDATEGQTGCFEKVVVLASSRESPAPRQAASQRLAELRGTGFDGLFAASAAAWKREWELSDVVIEGDDEAQLATRFSIYHLLIAAPRADDDDVSIAAKTLSGFGYHGHVFWDTETFMLPFFTHVHPRIARNLLSYRFHRLPGARRKAKAGGFAGAQIPWESADSGDEVTPQWVPDPQHAEHPVRIWTGDIEIHVSAAVAHAVMDYWLATGDDRFMNERGSEIVIETARFWASRAEWHAQRARYELSDVIGPDEYHEHVNNNAFTNHLAAWNLRTAADLAEGLHATDPDRARELQVDATTASRLRSVADRFYLPGPDANGLIEQFDGYFGLEQVDLEAHPGRTHSMQAILGIEGINRTQILKQPDVLMLAYLLPALFAERELAANYAYYTARTDHTYGSSLGPAIQAVLALRMDHVDEAYLHFMRAAGADLRDVRGNAGEGIHGASAGGLWQALVFGFAGVRFDGEHVITRPRLPSHWRRLAFHLVHRGQVVEIDLRQAESAEGPTEVRGLIFDLDGVITDTAELHYRAWKRLADELGVPFDRKANEALRGISRRESLRIVLGHRSVSEADAEALMTRKNGYYRELLKGLTSHDLLPGSMALLAAARERGLRTALASASRNASEVVDRLGIADRFDVICDGNTVDAPKPAPDLFLAAARRLGFPAPECVVFEDATDGIVAAHAAGMAAVGIGPDSRVGRAELVVSGLADVKLDEVLGLAAKRHRQAG